MTRTSEPTESTIVKHIIKALRDEEGWWVKIHGGPYQTAGLPDIVGCVRGIFIGLEVKRPSRRNQVSAIQAACLEAIAQAGGKSRTICSVEEGLEVVKEVQDEVQARPGTGGPLEDEGK